jgi:nitrate reductase delta subunit
VPEPAHPLKLASLLLAYPSAPLRALAADVAAGEVEPAPASGRQAERLRAFCAWYAGTPLAELERRYVTDVDFAKRASLHLTYHVHGDRRQRGLELLRLKEAYRAAGFEPPGDELPDYLPLMLEFCALAPPAAGAALLEEHRVSIELVRAALADSGSPWAPLLDAVVAAMGRLSSAKLARVRRLAAEGPPHEEVGLEPFAPPEVMPIDDPAAARPLVGEGGPR